MKPCILFFALFTLLVSLFHPAQAQSTSPANAYFDKLVDEYFDFYFHANPTQATEAGFHQYDNQLEDFSSAAVDTEIAGLQKYLAKFEQVPKTQLPEFAAGDLEFLCSQIRADLLELQQIQMWKKDPDNYTSGVSNSVFVLMSRTFAPPEDRLRSVIARERLAPKVFDAARHNLHNPPKIYTEVALQQLPDVIEFFKKDVPAAFSKVTDPQLARRIQSQQPGRDRGSAALRKLSSKRHSARVQRRLPHRCRKLSQEIALSGHGRHPARPSSRNRLCRSPRQSDNT